MLNVVDKMTTFALNSYSQDEIVGLENAAITKSAGLTGGCELHQTGTLFGIDGERNAFLSTDTVAIGGGHVPDAPGDALGPLPTSPRRGGAFDQACALGYATEF